MKIGIISFYYNSENYGANLQAYALCEVLKSFNIDAEQVSYCDNTIIKKIASNLLIRKRSSKRLIGLNKRKNAIKRFRESIPHSKVYYRNTIEKANAHYDGFIVGSDQVWNPSWLTRAYTLEFADANKLKVSYAASIGKNTLTEEEKRVFKKILEHFDYISVREPESIELLSGLTQKSVSWALDPTMIIGKDSWDAICAPKLIDEDYMFCYFLKDNQKTRDVASDYANKHQLKIVTIPHLSYIYRKCDDGFGDYQLYDIDPTDFISLIRYAKYVFTDSFHAAVFSHLYKREFVVFSQTGQQSMVRMNSLTEMFGTQERHIFDDEKFRTEIIESLKPIDYTKPNERYNRMKEQSINFIKHAIGIIK